MTRPLTIAEAFSLAPHNQHDRHGEVELHLVEDETVDEAPFPCHGQRLSSDSERLLAEMLRDEGFGS